MVPILAPIRTGMALRKFSRPELTKLTTITETTEEYCTITVVEMPVKTPRRRSRVMVSSMRRIRAPATCCRPSLISFMPNTSSAMEPASIRNCMKPKFIKREK